MEQEKTRRKFLKSLLDSDDYAVAQQYPWPMYLVTSHVLAPAAVAVAEPLKPSDGHPEPPGVPWKVRPNQDWPELVLSKASKLKY